MDWARREGRRPLLLEMDSRGDVLSDLERLLDQVSALYKARVEDLAPQARVVLDAVALAWDPVIAAEVGQLTGLPTTTVSAQLERLQRDGIVQKVSIARSRRAAYQLGERFFNIWYLMRHGPRRQRARLRWLSAFLRGFYTPAQLRGRAFDLLADGAHSGLGHGQYLLALGDALEDPALQRALAAEAERAITAYLARSGKRLSDIGDLSDLPRPETAEDWDLHGQLLHRHLGRLEEGEAAYRRALELDADGWWFWQHLGEVLRDTGRVEDADAAYLEAIQRGGVKYAWQSRSQLLLRLGRLDEVERAYRDALEADPGDALAWAALGALLGTDPGRWAEAEAAYRRAVECDPDAVAHRRGLAFLLLRQLRMDEAEALLKDALARQPEEAKAWCDLGYLQLYWKEHIEEAAAA